MKTSLIILLITVTCALSYPRPQIPFQPKHYLCHQTDGSFTIDGALDEPAWRSAAWTEHFVDIQGDLKPKPAHPTRVKMLWDDEYLYIAAELTEPHLWAKLTQRDTIIFYDNDFEVFIDPDGDTYNYYEIEINALNTVWDLYLDKPYRDGGTALFHWDIRGLQTGIDIQGTLNDPTDTDSCWTVEMAIPWDVLEMAAHRPAPPEDGDYWRINFSRVQWHTEIIDGKYVKQTDPQTGEHIAEENWVWSPQGLINMHYPEMWGFVHFTTQSVHNSTPAEFDTPEIELIKWQLWDIYYAQKNHYENHNTYTTDLKKFIKNPDHAISIETTSEMFQAKIISPDKETWNINQDGYIWKSE